MAAWPVSWLRQWQPSPVKGRGRLSRHSPPPPPPPPPHVREPKFERLCSPTKTQRCPCCRGSNLIAILMTKQAALRPLLGLQQAPRSRTQWAPHRLRTQLRNLQPQHSPAHRMRLGLWMSCVNGIPHLTVPRLLPPHVRSPLRRRPPRRRRPHRRPPPRQAAQGHVA
jgi:hypothetical protein